MKRAYSTPISVPLSGETAIYRSPETAKTGLISTVDNCKTLKDMFIGAKESYSKLNYLGTRQPNGQYTWISYEEAFKLATAFGSGLKALDLVPKIKDFQNMELSFLGIYCKNRAEYTIVDIAGVLYGITHVPLYDTLGPQAIEYILGQTKLETLVCSGETLLKFVNHGCYGNVKTVITFDATQDPKVWESLKANKIAYYTYKEIIEAGNKKQVPFVNTNERDIYVISYTSGTTGNPKGAMMTHGNFLAVTAVGKTGLAIKSGQIYLSFLPMAHAFERLMIFMLTYSGAAIGYYGGDALKLKDDFTALKPDIAAIVPRVFNKFHDLFQSAIASLRGMKKWIMKKAIAKKLQNLRTSNRVTHYTYDRLVLKKFREALGGRLKILVIGSAPTSKDVMDFMKVALSVRVQEGYGQTESTGASFITHFTDHTNSGCVGGPSSMAEFKLVDIPEMQYYSTDVDAQGKPAPRGEMCIRGPGLFAGYYKDEEKTKEAIDKDGWLHTGDVCMLQPNGLIKVIDRKKNIFKLSQGEYIAPEKLEAVFKTCSSVSEVFVWGESLQSYLIGIVVPELSVIKRWAQEKGIKYSTDDDLLNKKEIKIMVLEELKIEGKKKGFTSFEMLKNIHLEKNSFATKDLLTTTFKMKRHEAKIYYQNKIEEMYQEGMIH